MSSSETENLNYWRKCSSCKKPIAFGASYYVCSVSTCNNQRTGYVFCQIPCFETHLPGARHRDASAIEKKAEANPAHRPSPQRLFASTPGSSGSSSSRVTPSHSPSSAVNRNEILVIASRLKEYIDARSSGYNTSQSVMDVLSEHLRIVCDRAIENAQADGRKTVMDRDFSFLKNR